MCYNNDMKKSLIKSWYWNPILKIEQTEEETPYLKKDFTTWEEYATIIERVKIQK